MMEIDDDIDQIDNDEAEDFDWMSEGTYCSTNVTPKVAPIKNSTSSQRIPSSIVPPLIRIDEVGAVSSEQKSLADSLNSTVVSVRSSQQSSHTKNHLDNSDRGSEGVSSQTEQRRLYVAKSTNESSEDEITSGNDASDACTSSKYLTIPQRIVRTLNSGVHNVIRVLVPNDFLKKHKEPCAMFTCAHCSIITTDLQSLDDHMISLHDIGLNSNEMANSNSVGDGTLTAIEGEVDVSNKLCSKFTCSLCSLSLVSTQDWQLHFYLHLTNRIKRSENAKTVSFTEDNALNKSDVSDNLVDTINENVDLIPVDESAAANMSDLSLNDSNKNDECAEPVKSRRGRKRKSVDGISEDSSGGKAKVMMCKLCSQFQYTKIGEIKRHMLNEHGDQLHKCTYCEMAFPLGYEVLRHIRLYHTKLSTKERLSSRKRPIRGVKRGRGRPRLVNIRSESDQDDVEQVSEVSDNSRKHSSSAKLGRKTTPKKRRIVSDSEDDGEKDIQANEELLQDETIEKLTPRRRGRRPGRKNGTAVTNRRKGIAVKLKPAASDDDDNGSDSASEGGSNDPDWKDLKVRKSNYPEGTRVQPVRVSVEEVARVTGMGRGRGRPKKATTELGERKSGQLIECNHCGCCYEKRKELVDHIASEHTDKMLKCSKCTKTFALPKTLKIHLRICHAEETFNCSRCDQKFVTLNRLRLHIRLDHLGRPMAVVKKKLYGCSYCTRMFQTKQTLDGHTNQHHLNLRPYKCTKCGIDFAYINNFKIHERICLRSAMCELCGENFPNKGKLAEHQKSIHNTVLDSATDENKSEFFCDHCNKEFLDETSLNAHLARVRSAAQRSSVLCDICGKECKKAAGLTMHKAHCHPNEAKSNAGLPTGDEGANGATDPADTRTANSNGDLLAPPPVTEKTPVKCSDCNKTCRTSAALRIHRTRMHSNSISCRAAGGASNAESLCCPTCGQVCKGKVGLNSHLRSHGSTEPTNFKCDKCDRSFDNKFGLDMHRRHAHTDTRKYRQVAPCSCPICSKEFPREGPMKSHMTIVHGLPPATKKKPLQPAVDKVFSCPICSHQFKMKAYLQRHLRVHAGTKPYICTLCSKCFTSSTNLAGHMAALHKEVDYTYNPLVNMVCNVAANGELPQATANVTLNNPSASRKPPGASRKSSSSRKNTQAAAAMAARENFTEVVAAAPSREESVGYDDVLNMSREMQLMPRDMSGMLPVLPREMPNMMQPVMAARDMSNMPRDIHGIMVPRDMVTMPRDMSTVPRDNPNIPQYAIGTMPTNWNYAYMGEFYRL